MHYDDDPEVFKSHYDDPEVFNPHFLDPGNLPPVTSDDGIHDLDRRTLYGESLWRDLDERHINVSLFLGCGTSIAAAGPGGAVLGYILIGIIITSVMSGLGEMTALLPVNAPMMEFPRRFLDRGVQLQFFVMAGGQMVAVASTIKFLYDDGTTRLAWEYGLKIDNAWYGEMEYLFGCLKIIFISFLIVLMFVLDVVKPRGNAYYDETLGTKYWNVPWGFLSHAYTVRDYAGHEQRNHNRLHGPVPRTTFVDIFFSYVGLDVFAAAAAESRILLDNTENYKMATRKINLRIVLLYTLAVITGSFVVPSTNPFLNGHAPSVGAKSIFVIAVVEAGLPQLAHFLNAFYLFSAFTCAANNIYVSSRILHTLALRRQTGPEFITKRLRQCRRGVPVRAVLVSSLGWLLGYMGRTGSVGQRLYELKTYCTIFWLVVYVTIAATYLCFCRTHVYLFMASFQSIPTAHLNSTREAAPSTDQASLYDRDSPTYPYKSHGQWLKSAFGSAGCIIVLLFNGVPSLLQHPVDISRFMAAYVTIPVFFVFIIVYKVRKHILRRSRGAGNSDIGPWWGMERSNDLRFVQVTDPVRKGRFEMPDRDVFWTKGNMRFLGEWVWVWLK
ncbi:amino acid permease-domain-containing protein [Rhypophila decipiens]|uniref:Amino acid permease-domain-containing protein n=1 Tax=Rhypophila decipiens TaxID=261697 RepID=A0AAN7B2S7_9PEZI|nr:amino acid permease-domain-containing protein [Rhypophila decipiens]